MRHKHRIVLNYIIYYIMNEQYMHIPTDTVFTKMNKWNTHVYLYGNRWDEYEIQKEIVENWLDFMWIDEPQFITKKIERKYKLMDEVVKYMCENHHPHTKLIVDCTGWEILEWVETKKVEQYIKD